MNVRQLEKMGQAAEKEIQRLLKEHPEYGEYQAEIENRLAAAGSGQNRMAVLGFMMEAKLRELGEQLVLLEATRRKEQFS